VLIALGVILGLVLGGWLTCIRGPVLLLVGLALFPIVYFWAAEALGWPTPGSVTRAADRATEPAAGVLLAVTIAVTTAVVVTVLVKAGVSRYIENWAASCE
jgi:uncharacterized membrane protein